MPVLMTSSPYVSDFIMLLPRKTLLTIRSHDPLRNLETSRRERSSWKTPGRSVPPSPNRLPSSFHSRNATRMRLATFQFKNAFHAQPFLAWLCFWQRLLESPHELLPSLHLRILLIGLGFLFKRKTLVYFHDHEHARAEQVNLQIFDAGVL